MFSAEGCLLMNHIYVLLVTSRYYVEAPLLLQKKTQGDCGAHSLIS